MAQFKEFERRFKFKPRLKYGWFHLKLISNVSIFKPALNLNRVFADLNAAQILEIPSQDNYITKSEYVS